MNPTPTTETREKKVKKIKKLDIDLFKDAQESDYAKERTSYIAEYKEYIDSTRQYIPGGFFSSGYWIGKEGHYIKNPTIGEVEWNKTYPEGYDSWKVKQYHLNAFGEQLVIDKLNEIISFLNRTLPN